MSWVSYLLVGSSEFIQTGAYFSLIIILDILSGKIRDLKIDVLLDQLFHILAIINVNMNT